MHQRYVTNRQSLLYLSSTANQELNWFSTDQEEKYECNKHKLDPVYLDLDITYKFNSLGYRTGELSEYETNKFFIAMGCSYTVGEGLALQHRWSDQLSELTGLKNLNLGISGSGLDTHLINSLHYVNGKNPKPRMVVIQHPEVCRVQRWYSFQDDSLEQFSEVYPENSLTMMTNLHNEITRELDPLDPHDRRAISEPVVAGYHTELLTHLWNSIGVPVINWCFSGDADVSKKYMDSQLHSFPADFPELCADWPGDVARDGAHDGIKNNKAVADTLYEKFIRKLL